METNLYKSITNPLENGLVNEMLYNYIYFDNMNDVITTNRKPKEKKYSIIFHDLLFKNNFDEWNNKIEKLFNSLDKDDIIYNDIKTLYYFLSKYNVKSFKDVNNVINWGYETYPELFNKYCFFKKDKKNYNVINTFENGKKLEHCLVLNCEIKKMYLFLYKFYEKCKFSNLDYCIKFNDDGMKVISVMIYSDTDNLETYLNIIKDIIEKDIIIDSLDSLPPVVGNISDKVGYISSSDDFFERRCDSITSSIENETAEWIEKSFNTKVKTSSGREIPYEYFLFGKIVKDKKNTIGNHFIDEKYNKEFTYTLLDNLLKNYKNIISAVLLKKYDYRLTIPFKSISVIFTYADFVNIFKMQAEYFKNNYKYREGILKRIKEKSYLWDIDSDNFGIDTECSYLLGREKTSSRGKVTLEMLNNFDISLSSNREKSREGRILDSNIPRKKEKKGFFSKFKKNK